jgi:uncharacterized membrane protein SpoIIM required for sporulation
VRVVFNILRENRTIFLIALYMWALIIVMTFLSIFLQAPIENSESFTPVKLQWYNIFMHNVGVALVYIILGNLSFGILAFLLMLFNIYMTSYAVYYSYMHTGSIGFSTALIFTHGFIEIAAMILCFVISTTTMRWAINKIYMKTIFNINTVENKAFLCIWMVLLYLIASFIESYISPVIPTKLL